MAIIYYPKSATVIQRDVTNSSYSSLIIDVEPNAIFVFDTGSNISTSLAVASASISFTSSISRELFPGVTAWYSISSSYTSASISSSYSTTAATVLNPNLSNLYFITASTGTIPINITLPEHYLSLTSSTFITFSCVSSSTTNTVLDSCVYINNTSPANIGLYFPTNWVNLNGGAPLSLTASKNAVILLRSVNNSPNIVSCFNIQL